MVRLLGGVDSLVATGKPTDLFMIGTIVVWGGGALGILPASPLVVPLLLVFPSMGLLVHSYAYHLRSLESRGRLVFWRINFWAALGMIVFVYWWLWRILAQVLANQT